MNLEEKYFRHGPHLASFRRLGEMREHWEQKWEGSVKSFLASSRSGRLGEFEYPFISYLPRQGLILEAGCGTGRYVCALRARGYDIEGIDYAEDTITAIQAIDPSLNVRQSDIFAIDRPDGYYAGYISIGVLEHTFDGPEAGLREAFRVLRPGGIAVITVPQLNHPRRRCWQHAQEAPSAEMPGGLRFYQDHLDAHVFHHDLVETGFEVLEVYPYEVFGGFIRDSRMGRYLQDKGFFSWRLRKMVKHCCERAPRSLRSRYSHMMAFICRRG